MLEFNTLFMYFVIYSILGWICEMIYCSVLQWKITNRGFMYGPYCPIYGFGGIIVVIFLSPIYNNPVIVFLLGMILTTILEYVTSFFMEKIFNAKWWDYSHLPLNINGRVCLVNSFLFGIMGLFLTYMIHPYISNVVHKIPVKYFDSIVLVLVVVMVIDFMSTLNIILNLKQKLIWLKELAESMSDKSKLNNIELIKQLEELKANTINKSSIFYKRILEAFPYIEFEKFNKQIEELKIALNKMQIERKNKKTENKDKK